MLFRSLDDRFARHLPARVADLGGGVGFVVGGVGGWGEAGLGGYVCLEGTAGDEPAVFLFPCVNRHLPQVAEINAPQPMDVTDACFVYDLNGLNLFHRIEKSKR